MFGWLKSDPKKKLEKAWKAKLEEAMATQRAGDIPKYATLMREAEDMREKLDALEAAEAS